MAGACAPRPFCGQALFSGPGAGMDAYGFCDGAVQKPLSNAQKKQGDKPALFQGSSVHILPVGACPAGRRKRANRVKDPGQKQKVRGGIDGKAVPQLAAGGTRPCAYFLFPCAASFVVRQVPDAAETRPRGAIYYLGKIEFTEDGMDFSQDRGYNSSHLHLKSIFEG